MDERTPLLVLGLGNIICGDDGLGVAAVAQLNALYEPPAGVTVIDGGTLGLSLLPWVEDAARVLLIDAVRADAPAGTFVRLEGDEVGPAVALRLSPHQVGVADLLESARWRGRYPAEVILLGLVPQTIELSVDLSAPVVENLERLVTEITREAARLGFRFRRREEHEAFGSDHPERGGVADGVSGA